MPVQTPTLSPVPWSVFRFRVEFYEQPLKGEMAASDLALCQGAFSEVSGLEATMEPRVIKEGGRTYGTAQRVGPVTFGTVILRRGMTRDRSLARWFHAIAFDGRSAMRLRVDITLHVPDAKGDPQPIVRWELHRALPTRIKFADLNASSQDVAVEEIQLAHEGLVEKVEGGTA